jgi:glycosyltransferase involved in cell wall biosynthesis
VKVLFCKNSFAGPISGADEIAVTYAIELKAAGHSTEVLLVHPPPSDNPLAARLSAAGVPLTSLASSAFSNSLAAGRKLAIRAMRAFPPASLYIRSNSRRLVFDLVQRYHDTCREHLLRTRPDVLHVMTPDPGAVMLIRAAHAVDVPVVYQEVGIPFHPSGFEEVYERFLSALPLCAEVAVLSPRLAGEMMRAVPQLRAPRVLPLISLDTASGLSWAARPTGEFVRFGFAARLEHLKGPLPLVEGFRLAHRAWPYVELSLAGDGSLREEVVATLRSHRLEEKCCFVGVFKTLTERSRFMQDIDVFVLPSLTEGTPNAIIEAMAHAKPIVATDVGGIPDVVTEDVGILVPPNDTKALGAAMARLAGDAKLRRRMGLSARKRYEQLFTPEAVLPLLIDFYEQVVNGHLAVGNGRNHPLEGSTHPWALT